MTVAQFGELRDRIRPLHGRFQVVKNSAFAKAAEELGVPVDAAALQGPTAILAAAGDMTEAAKLLAKFTKEFQRPVVKGGLLDRQHLSPEDVAAMAALPGREVLLGRLVGTVAAPMSQLVGVMNQKLLSLLYVLKAAAEKQG
jgi:large subunit ribosomal protein L10